MTFPKFLWAVFAMIAVSGCAERVYAPDEAVAAARYVSDEAPYVSLMTMVRYSDGKGAHSAIIANGSQVALYDPAGTFRHPTLPERNDVFYGLTPQMKEAYELFHARDSHYVLEQRLPVSRAFADSVIARMEAQGPSSKMMCSINTAEILRDFPIWANVPASYFPSNLRDAFGAVEGVTERRVEEDDVGKNVRLVLVNGL